MPLDLSNHDHIKQVLTNYLSEKKPDLSDLEKEDFHSLLNDTMGGLESAQYLTGHKKNEVETFYDKHPVQATIHDLLNKAPVLAAGAVGGQVGHSVLKDYFLNKKINQAVKGNDKKDGLKGLGAEDYERNPDLHRVFPKATQSYTDKDLTKYKFDPSNDPGKYGDLYQKLNVGKNQLSKPTPSGPIADLLQSGNRKEERMVRLMSQHFPTDSLENGKENPEGVRHLRNIAQEVGGLNRHRSGRVAGRVAQRLADPNMKFKNMMSHVNPRLAAGAAAVGLGGMALSPMVSYLQKKIYGDQTVKDWMKNRRQSEGKFD